MADLLERLPTELLEMIFQHVDKATTKNLRPVSKPWNELASPQLYPRLWLSSHPLDNEVFAQVTANPLLRKGVKELIWDDTTFSDSLAERDKYMKTFLEAENTNHYVLGDLVVSEEAFEHFSAVVKKHWDIRERRLDEQLLLKALPKLRNLEKVVLTNRHHFDPVPDDREVEGESPTARHWRKLPFCDHIPFQPEVSWSTAEDGQAFDLEGYPLLDEICSRDYHVDPWDEEWITYRSCIQVSRPFRGLIILLKALKETRTNVREFEIRAQYKGGAWDLSDSGISHWIFRKWSPMLDSMVSVFQNLRRLDFVLGSDEGRFLVQTVEQGHLSRVIQSARQLECMSLELPDAPVMDVVGQLVHFAFLQDLRLRDGRVEPMQLFEFFKRHKPTLRSVTLVDCTGIETWDKLFYAMQSEKLCFDEMYFGDLGDPGPPAAAYRGNLVWTGEKAAGDFLINNGPYPFVWDDHRSGTPPTRF